MCSSHFRDAAGREWCGVSGPEGVYWWMIGTSSVQWTLQRGTPPGQGGIEILAAVGTLVGDVPVTMQGQFPASSSSSCLSWTPVMLRLQVQQTVEVPQLPRNALFDSGSRGWLLEELQVFYAIGQTLDPEVDSRRFSPCAHGRRGSSRARRQHAGFDGISAPRAVFPMIAGRSACTRRESVHSRCFARRAVLPRKTWTIFP